MWNLDETFYLTSTKTEFNSIVRKLNKQGYYFLKDGICPFSYFERKTIIHASPNKRLYVNNKITWGYKKGLI